MVHVNVHDNFVVLSSWSWSEVQFWKRYYLGKTSACIYNDIADGNDVGGCFVKIAQMQYTFSCGINLKPRERHHEILHDVSLE
jgi:hypothetical protein